MLLIGARKHVHTNAHCDGPMRGEGIVQRDGTFEPIALRDRLDLRSDRSRVSRLLLLDQLRQTRSPSSHHTKE